MVEETFDINEIIGIKLTEESEVGNYEWVDAVPEKRIFFGLIKTQSASPAGFLDLHSWEGGIYTVEELEEYGYKVYIMDERIISKLLPQEPMVFRKPHVKIYLSHELTVEKVFETNREARSWVDQLKLKSGKTFETVVH